jgi:hypothetical protein
MHRLPDDVLRVVADHAQCPAAAAVCRRWWGLLRHRHLIVHHESHLDRVADSGAPGRVRTLECSVGQVQYASAHRVGVLLGPHAGSALRRLSCRLVEGDLTALLAAAAACDRLETLELVCAAANATMDSHPIRFPASLTAVSLSLPGTRLPAPDVQRLITALRRDAPRLAAVDVDVRWNYELGGNDMRAFAPLLRPDAHLRRLRLALAGCTWNGDAVLCALVPPAGDPRGGPGLRDLHLVLDDMDVGEWGAVHGLQVLLDLHPRLERLRLSAGDAPTGLSDRTVPGLIAAVAHAPRALRSLDLSFRGNGLADRGYFRPLAKLGTLETLRLDVSNNPRLGIRAARSLGLVLGACPVRRFHLYAANTGLRDVYADGGSLQRPLCVLHLGGGCVRIPSLLAASVSPALEHLCLNLNAAVVGDRGCAEIAAHVGRAPRLTHLALVAVRNGIGDVGLGHLTAVVGALRHLRTLVLELSCNLMGTDGVANLLGAIGALPRLTHLHLDVSHSNVEDRIVPILHQTAGLRTLDRFFFASPGVRGFAPDW